MIGASHGLFYFQLEPGSITYACMFLMKVNKYSVCVCVCVCACVYAAIYKYSSLIAI